MREAMKKNERERKEGGMMGGKECEKENRME